MKKSKIILKRFEFLYDYGFTFDVGEKEMGDIYCFSSNDKIRILISLSNDYRDENRIGFILKKGTTILLSFYDKIPMVNCELTGLDEMIYMVNMVYKNAKDNRKGFDNSHFIKIIDLYSKFIFENIQNLTNK